MHEEALRELDGIGADTDGLRWIADYIVTRGK
jgi:hypothetical protein